MARHATIGYASVIVAALLWASCGTAGKALFGSGIPPALLVQTRVTLASLILGAFLAAWRPSLLRIGVKDLGFFLVFGGVFMASMQLAYFMAISKIQVAAAILVQYLAPVIVAAYSMAFWHERVTAKKAAALALSMAGCYLVVGGYSLRLVSLNLPGILWALLSAFAFAGTTLLGEKGMHTHNPWTSLMYALLFSAVSLNVAYEPLQILSVSYTPIQWGAILYIVVFGTLIPFGLYLTGVNYIRSTRTIITATLEPIAAAVMAFWLLGERLSVLQAAGGFAVISAVVLLQLEREHDERSPESIRATARDRR